MSRTSFQYRLGSLARMGMTAAMAGKMLKEMGFEKVYNLGGFKEWKEGGGAVEEPVDPGM